MFDLLARINIGGGERSVLQISAEIPEGKVISSIHGGVKALQMSLEKLKKFEFTGYILVQNEIGSVSQGILVVKDGITFIAQFLFLCRSDRS